MILSRHEACDPDLTADPGLTQEGVVRAHSRAQSLALRALQVILYSPRRRARETAEVFAAVLGPTSIFCVEMLREVNPAIIFPEPPSEHPDVVRAQRILRETVARGLRDYDVLDGRGEFAVPLVRRWMQQNQLDG